MVFIRTNDRFFLELLIKCNMEEAMQFLQDHMAEDFGYSDDEVIESLRECIEKLRRAKLIDPPPPDQIEGPKSAFGTILLSPYEEVMRSVSVMDRPKKSKRPGQHLRDTRSADNTPINRPNKNHMAQMNLPNDRIIDGSVSSNNITTIIPIDGDRLPKSPLKSPAREPRSPAYAPIVKRSSPGVSQRELDAEETRVVIRTPKTSPSRTLTTGVEDDSFSRMKQTPSFYDNIPMPPVESPIVPVVSPTGYAQRNGYTKTQERIEYRTDGPGQYRTEYNIESYVVSGKSPTVSPGYATIGDRSSETANREQANIHRRSNYITYVEVVPDEQSTSSDSARIIPGQVWFKILLKSGSF